ncbi:MAG: hypothetical protein H7257_06340 [Taibaiella sp.]|nr:hypothetical protein [Taibaiella sp.]
MRARYALLLCLVMAFFSLSVAAQPAEKGKKKKHGALYFSWGYNQEWYTRSTVHVTQSALGNDYELVKVRGNDHMGWNNKSIFRQALTIPQYNYRLGYFFNEKQDMAIELNFDHTKYIITQGQQVRVRGTLAGQPVDKEVTFTEQNGFYYFLNNGANFFLFNFVKRWGLYRPKNNSFALDLLGKAGVGPVVPHVENKLFGVANDPHFQLGGWNTGIETALKLTVLRYGYLELAQKVDYARYSNLKMAAGGTGRQAFGTYELILSLGFMIPCKPQNPLFAHPQTNIVKQN